MQRVVGGEERSELVVGPLEYGLQAARESAGLVPDLPPMERWRNGWLGVTAEAAQRFGSGSALEQIWSKPGTVCVRSNNWTVSIQVQ